MMISLFILLGAKKVFNTEEPFRFVLNKPLFAGRSEGKTMSGRRFEESKKLSFRLWRMKIIIFRFNLYKDRF